MLRKDHPALPFQVPEYRYSCKQKSDGSCQREGNTCSLHSIARDQTCVYLPQ